MNWKGAIRAGVAVLLAFAASANIARSSDAESLRQTHELTAVDVDTWLDGYLPYALAQADTRPDSSRQTSDHIRRPRPGSYVRRCAEAATTQAGIRAWPRPFGISGELGPGRAAVSPQFGAGSKRWRL